MKETIYEKIHPCNWCWRTDLEFVFAGGGLVYALGCKCGNNISGKYYGCEDSKIIAIEKWNIKNPKCKRPRRNKK